MKKWDLVKKIAKEADLSYMETNKVLDIIGRVIVQECRDNGEDVSIPTLGTFKQKVNAARKGRNPLNGEEIDIKGSKTIQFRPMPSIKIFEK